MTSIIYDANPADPKAPYSHELALDQDDAARFVAQVIADGGEVIDIYDLASVRPIPAGKAA
jgi:hypothetical protein